MAEPLPVSVVIPAWRCADFIEGAVRSALGQTRPPLEVLVVDDASGDATPDRARAAGATVIEHGFNQGPAKARNDGIEAARGEWVALLDSDDEWLAHHLETLWVAREDHVLVAAAAVTFGDGGEPRALGWARRRPLRLGDPARAMAPENPIRTSGVMFKREAAIAAGGFRTDLRRFEDMDLWIRLLESGTGVCIPVVTSLYRVHASQSSADREAGWAVEQAMLAGYAGRPWLTAGVRKRREGAVAWDAARLHAASGGSKVTAARRIARAAIDPRRAGGIASLLLGRRAQRRLGSSTRW